MEKRQEVSSATTEDVSGLTLRRAKRTARKIGKAVRDSAPTGVTTKKREDLGFCIRPSRELGELQREVYRKYGYGTSVNPRSSVYFFQSEDAVGLFYGSAHFLEYRSHRFIFADDGSVSYHREPFGVDCQAIGSRPIELDTIEAIAAHTDARNELFWLSHISECSSEDWRKRIGSIAIVDC